MTKRQYPTSRSDEFMFLKLSTLPISLEEDRRHMAIGTAGWEIGPVTALLRYAESDKRATRHGESHQSTATLSLYDKSNYRVRDKNFQGSWQRAFSLSLCLRPCSVQQHQTLGIIKFVLWRWVLCCCATYLLHDNLNSQDTTRPIAPAQRAAQEARWLGQRMPLLHRSLSAPADLESEGSAWWEGGRPQPSWRVWL
ncbi:hypothetical protein BDP55DRAFT_717401 [Colletotrichum godetiae]|uniref:Uncharacterized protein n=1 Tax=Colletotrichum godetiae TaxID=1209918 RepID=A0AAJ0EVG2_9PEZI|nr:uncharacterized protein BDP55DRAFT_717401 [Colletotrichum godetiae]KAK1673225.1 hypothetical protein BDP55DRAFT_717401 [Colletotrichum godetiae]